MLTEAQTIEVVHLTVVMADHGTLLALDKNPDLTLPVAHVEIGTDDEDELSASEVIIEKVAQTVKAPTSGLILLLPKIIFSFIFTAILLNFSGTPLFAAERDILPGLQLAHL